MERKAAEAAEAERLAVEQAEAHRAAEMAAREEEEERAKNEARLQSAVTFFSRSLAGEL